MNFFKRKYTVRRYLAQKLHKGYISMPYEDLRLPMDIQTLEDKIITTEDGSRSLQTLKTFCDYPIIVTDTERQQKADRIWFQEKWFECTSSRLSENTSLRHYTATFTECLDQEGGPKEVKP